MLAARKERVKQLKGNVYFIREAEEMQSNQRRLQLWSCFEPVGEKRKAAREDRYHDTNIFRLAGSPPKGLVLKNHWNGLWDGFQEGQNWPVVVDVPGMYWLNLSLPRAPIVTVTECCRMGYRGLSEICKREFQVPDSCAEVFTSESGGPELVTPKWVRLGKPSAPWPGRNPWCWIDQPRKQVSANPGYQKKFSGLKLSKESRTSIIANVLSAAIRDIVMAEVDGTNSATVNLKPVAAGSPAIVRQTCYKT